MKKMMLVILVIFGLMVIGCDNGSSSSGDTTDESENYSLIGRWYTGSGSGSYLEFLDNGDFNNYHSLSDSYATAKYTYTIDDINYIIYLTNTVWRGENRDPTTIEGYFRNGGKSLQNTNVTSWNRNAWMGGWIKE
jgi:hypothetical protein